VPLTQLTHACAQVIKGDDLAVMDAKQLDEVLDFPEIVFARTSPAQKLTIVQGLQVGSHGKRVAPQPR
jgi:magnesium-transporting ATPase (P-type)